MADKKRIKANKKIKPITVIIIVIIIIALLFTIFHLNITGYLSKKPKDSPNCCIVGMGPPKPGCIGYYQCPAGKFDPCPEAAIGCCSVSACTSNPSAFV